jgi:hypothetical protein
VDLGFHVHTQNDSKNKFLTPRQLVRIYRIFKTDDAPLSSMLQAT